ncbi:hypothetical protein [Serinicoccus sp. LYQ131]|uniref:hypothetical protein n=1 Tax=Serinicoccus sp. LYQ131 TaxID=3378797 RepID=UPI0038537875
MVGRRRFFFAPVLICALILLLAMPQVATGASPSPVPVSSWRVNGKVSAVLVVGPTVYVGGNFTTATSPAGETVARRNLAAFDAATGELRRTFTADAGSTVQALASDGAALYVGGHFGQVRGVVRSRLAKVSLATGAVDTAFRADANGAVLGLDVRDGWLYAGGDFTAVGAVTRQRVAKVLATTGAVDTAFIGRADAKVMSVVTHPTQNVLFISGNFTAAGGAPRTGVAAVSSTTGTAGAPSYQSSVRPILDLALNDDGSLLFGALGAGSNSATAWDSGTGVRRWRQTTMGDVQAVDHHGGQVYFGFHDGYENDTRLKLLVADAVTGVVDDAFRPTFDNFWGVFALDATPTGVIAGGVFTMVSGIPAQGFVRFTGGTSPPSTVPRTYVDGSNASWTYWDRGNLAQGWQGSAHDDSGWARGSAEFGYGDGDEATPVSWGPSGANKHITTYFRTRFTVDTVPQNLVVSMIIDDGATVYINGVEAARDNMPVGTVTGSTRASTNRDGQAERALRVLTLDPALLVSGTNTLAIEVHQFSPSSSDLSMDADLVGSSAP